MRAEIRAELYFEALYIYLKYIYNKKYIDIKETGIKAIQRILKVSPWQTIKEIEEFLDLTSTNRFVNQAEMLYEKLLMRDKGSFFEELSDEELFLYYNTNFEVSRYYGAQLGGVIDFKGKKILDIGGSSGGLVNGIQSVCPRCETAVFDLKMACEIGLGLCDYYNFKTKFFSGNFFEKIQADSNYDYLILSNILHDWNDMNAIKILSNAKNLINVSTKIIIYEDIVLEEEKLKESVVLYGLRLCANVPEGRQRNTDEIMDMMKKAYKTVPVIKRVLDFGSHEALIVQSVHN